MLAEKRYKQKWSDDPRNTRWSKGKSLPLFQTYQYSLKRAYTPNVQTRAGTGTVCCKEWDGVRAKVWGGERREERSSSECREEMITQVQLYVHACVCRGT